MMSVHVDWLTIVGRRSVIEGDWTLNAAYNEAETWLIDTYQGDFDQAIGQPHRWQIVKPRAPYSFARRSDDNSRTLYVHPLAAHFTLEVSGTHCQRVAQDIPTICKSYAGCFSRLDIACDMDTQVTPAEFDQAIKAERILTRSHMISSTGQTVYVGSRTSERFARIYRYNAPHPRSHLLRAEFQLKGKYANGAAEAIAQGIRLPSLAAGLGQDFGFTHSCWETRESPALVRIPSHAQSGATVHWLCTTVAPLLKRLEREGKLDVQAWLAEYVTNQT